MQSRLIKARQPSATPAVWLLRWLVVLVLIWDQAGSPLHQHQHDSGVDAQWLSASAHGFQAAGPHLEDGDHDLRMSHAVLAVRPQLDLSPLAFGDESDSSFASPHVPAQATPDPRERLIPAAAASVPHSTYRSLPPAGRAPPLHT